MLMSGIVNTKRMSLHWSLSPNYNFPRVRNCMKRDEFYSSTADTSAYGSPPGQDHRMPRTIQSTTYGKYRARADGAFHFGA